MMFASGILFKRVVLVLSILVSMAFGYMFGYMQKIEVSKPVIRKIPEVNEKVPTVDIESFQNGHVSGRVGEMYVRLRSQGKVIVPAKDGTFELDIGS